MNKLMLGIENLDGILIVDSRKVAKKLGVRHDHLLDKINGYMDRFHSTQTCAQFYISSTYKDKSGKSNKNYLITEKGMQIIAQKSQWTKANQADACKQIIQKIGGTCNTIVANTRFETSFINMLDEALKEINIKGTPQYRIDNGKYRIDYYIPSLKLAIEYDEEQHNSQINMELDEQREKYIINQLGCKFIRCDYKKSDIKNVMKVLKKIGI